MSKFCNDCGIKKDDINTWRRKSGTLQDLCRSCDARRVYRNKLKRCSNRDLFNLMVKHEHRLEMVREEMISRGVL